MDTLEAGTARGLFTVFVPFLPVARDAAGAFEAAVLLTFEGFFSPLLPLPTVRPTAALLDFRPFTEALALAGTAFFAWVFFFALVFFFATFVLLAPFALCVLLPFATFFPVAFLVLFAAGESGARFLSFTVFRVPPAAAFDAFFLVETVAFVDFLARFIM